MHGADTSKILISAFRISLKLKVSIITRFIIINIPFASHFKMIGSRSVDFRPLEKMLTAPEWYKLVSEFALAQIDRRLSDISTYNISIKILSDCHVLILSNIRNFHQVYYLLEIVVF